MVRVKTLLLTFVLAAGVIFCGCTKSDAAAHAVSSTGADKSAAAHASASAKVDFDAQIKPLLESKCTPCHFAGGQMYERLPFDRPETIRKLGTRLFTRLKDENDQRLIKEFLAQ